MLFSLLSQPDRRYRRKGNRTIGKIWLAVIFVVLTATNYAATFVLPYIGKYAKPYQAVLFVAAIWSTVLIGAIWKKQGWARVALALFLFCMVALQLVYVPDVMVRYPNFRDNGLEIILLHSVTNVLAALFLILSLDIRWISHPSIE